MVDDTKPVTISGFRDTLKELMATNSRTDKKEIIREVGYSPAAISFLSGQEFDDAGLGKKTVLSVAQDVYGNGLDGQPTVSENLEQFDRNDLERNTISDLHSHMKELAEKSGNNQNDKLKALFQVLDYPSVVSHACLNDLPTGVSDKTIADALEVRDSLPFYDNVVEAATAEEPLTSPEVGKAFDPMLAKPESSLPDDLDGYVGQLKLDGYRCVLHISNGSAKAFTRRRNDVTESLPELEEITFPDGEWIVDCEIVAETGDYSDVSERVGRKAKNVSQEIGMEFAVFDILSHNSSDIHSRPFSERYGMCVTFADLTPDERVGALPIYTDGNEAARAASEYEGLIWKDLDAPYEFGKRSSAWVKQKHDPETIDLIAAGFVEGEGRLNGMLGKINLKTGDGVPVGSVGTGFTDEQRTHIWENRRDLGGMALEVEAEALGSEGALRFPVFQRWRIDDGEADTFERVETVLPET